MKAGVLGTGIVGRSIAAKLVEVGHEVMMGSRSADNPEATAWVAGAGAGASQGTFADAAAFGEVLVNATSGAVSLEVLATCAVGDLDGKVLVDVSNHLDFSQGFPPAVAIGPFESMGERIQAAHPGARVVKTFNTVSAPVMVNPGIVPGHHTIFLSGNDAAAKATVAELQQSFGWPPEDIVDLGDITTARGVELYLPLWARMFGVVGKPAFNIHLVRG
jgi:predicted dinucleotide-binding enzyme